MCRHPWPRLFQRVPRRRNERWVDLDAELDRIASAVNVDRLYPELGPGLVGYRSEQVDKVAVGIAK